MLRNDDLEILFRMLGIKINNFDVTTVYEPEAFNQRLIDFLGKVEAEIHTLPEKIRTTELLKQFAIGVSEC